MSLLNVVLLAVEEGETVNPILPEVNEIVWGSISFLVLFFLMAKVAFPAVKKGMDARADRIRASLDEAERTRTEASAILDQYQRQLADAKAESARIIEAARQDADKIRQELRRSAEAEAADIRQRAKDDIAQEAERVKAGLRAEMASLTVELAERVVERSLDRDTNLALIESFINQAGRQPAH